MHYREIKKLIKEDVKEVIIWANVNGRHDLVSKYKGKRAKLRRKLYEFNTGKKML